MIPLNTVCLIVRAPELPEVLGMECTITEHDPLVPGNHIAQTRDGQYVMGPQRCYLPLNPLTPALYIGYRHKESV